MMGDAYSDLLMGESFKSPYSTPTQDSIPDAPEQEIVVSGHTLPWGWIIAGVAVLGWVLLNNKK